MTRFPMVVLVLALVAGREAAAQESHVERKSSTSSIVQGAQRVSGARGSETSSGEAAEEKTPAAAPGSDASRPGDRGRTRLMLGPTARAMRPGEFYLDLSSLVGGPFVQIGVTNRISIGAGTPVIIPGIRPLENFVVTPKVQVLATRRVEAAVGLMHFRTAAGHSGIAYSVVTAGTVDAAVTGGLGVPYADGRQNGPPALMLSGEKRVSPRLKLISENYAGPGGGLVMGGVRATRGHGSFDLGLARVIGGRNITIVPILRFAWNL
jgi:hypothetical protein